MQVVTLPDWIVMPPTVLPPRFPVGLPSCSLQDASLSCQPSGAASVTDSVFAPIASPIVSDWPLPMIVKEPNWIGGTGFTVNWNGVVVSAPASLTTTR